MQISVIIPTYRPKDYIWECLDSLRQQTLSRDEFEIILILNGEKEPYHSRIKEYLSLNLKDFNVNMIYTEVSGVSNARNIALDNAQGEYITFIDDDDYISSTYLEDLYNVSDRNTIGAARPIAFNDKTNASVIYPITDLFDKLYPRKNMSFLRLRRYFIGPCMKLIHRDIINNRRFNTSFSVGEDGLFMFLISDEFYKCSLANERSIYYRRYRDGSLVAKRTREFIKVNNRRLLKATWDIYQTNTRRYNLMFFLMQVVSYIKSIIC